MVSSMLNNANANILGKGSESAASERKPAYRALRLDAQGMLLLSYVAFTRTSFFMFFVIIPLGREIDEYGNVVKTGVVKTLAANMAVEKANKKKENPYLAHRTVNTAVVVASDAAVSGAGVPAPEAGISTDIVDERLPQLRRDLRGKKALHFVEAGKFIEEAEKIKAKEERKIIAGYASGRKAIQHQAQQQVGVHEHRLAWPALMSANYSSCLTLYYLGCIRGRWWRGAQQQFRSVVQQHGRGGSCLPRHRRAFAGVVG